MQEDVSKVKHSSRSEHNPDYTAGTFVVTPNSKYYPGKSGDKFCHMDGEATWFTTSFIQTKENEFVIQTSASGKSESDIDYGLFETRILSDAAAIGRVGNFKYGVFDNTEERTQEKESEVTGSTSITIGSETGVVTPLYNSTYGVRFGDAHTTRRVERTPGQVIINRKHSVRYYESEPNIDGYFDVELVLSSLSSNSNLNAIDHKIPNAKYCVSATKAAYRQTADWLIANECMFFPSSRKDFARFER